MWPQDAARHVLPAWDARRFFAHAVKLVMPAAMPRVSVTSPKNHNKGLQQHPDPHRVEKEET
jgi:hypothetical protein